MGILDRYIIKKLLITFFFSMLLFTLVAVAVDISEKTDDFVKSGLSKYQIFSQYYLGFIPHIWSLLYPLFVFISVIFFTSKMASRSEIIAVLASGVSFNRFLRPFLITGIILATIIWLGNAFIIPKANILKGDFQENYLDKNDPSKSVSNSSCYNCFYKRMNTNTYIGIKYYDTASKSSNKFFLEMIEDDKVVYNLRSNSLKWDTTVNQWKIYDVIERRIDSLQETVRVVKEMVLRINLKPEELRSDDYMKDRLTTPELARFIEREELRGSEGLSSASVERYRRTATAVSVILLTMIGVVIASRKTRGGSGMHLAIGIVIAVLFVLIDRFSTVFATKGNFHPLIAAWTPNMLFTIVAVFFYRKAPK